MQQKEKLMYIEDPLSHIQSYYIIVAYYICLVISFLITKLYPLL